VDGGWTAWRLGGHPTCALPCGYAPGAFTAILRPEMVASKQDVLAAIGNPDVCLINALGRRQHRGEINEYGRRGHIPGSRNVTAWEILDRATQRYRELPELRRTVGSALDSRQIITYCGAGGGSLQPRTRPSPARPHSRRRIRRRPARMVRRPAPAPRTRRVNVTGDTRPPSRSASCFRACGMALRAPDR
jgi:hypothetical protein